MSASTNAYPDSIMRGYIVPSEVYYATLPLPALPTESVSVFGTKKRKNPTHVSPCVIARSGGMEVELETKSLYAVQAPKLGLDPIWADALTRLYHYILHSDMPKLAQNTQEFIETLPQAIAALFQGAQASNATHKRRINTLCRLFDETVKVTQEQNIGRKGNEELVVVLVGEKAFNRAFWSLLLHVFNIKRGISAADRVIKFVGAFIGTLMASEDMKAEESDQEQSPRERFFQRLVKRTIAGCTAKDKTSRFRCTQLLSEMLRHVSSLDDNMYDLIKVALLERCTDREWTIRAVSCVGLGVLARVESFSEDQTSLQDSNDTRISTVLEELCLYDVHSQVRIAALPGMALPLTSNSLALLLTRCRDVDASVRKMAFRLLSQIQARALSVSQRSTVVRNGLGDRESHVRNEATKLIYKWAVDCSSMDRTNPNTSTGKQAQATTTLDLDEFLDLFDLWDGEVAEEALKALIYKRPDVMDSVNLNHSDYWSAFSPTKAILARVFTELVSTATQQSYLSFDTGAASTSAISSRSRDKTINASVSILGTSQAAPFDGLKYVDSLPVLTLQAFNIQGLFNLLLESADSLNSQEQLHSLPPIPGVVQEDLEEQLDDCIFSLGELLKMATSSVDTLGADEMGRRKLNGLVEYMIAHRQLPENLFHEAFTLWLKLSDTAAHFIRSIVRRSLFPDEISLNLLEAEPILQEISPEEDYGESRSLPSHTFLDSVTGLTGLDGSSHAAGSDNEKLMAAYKRLCKINIALEISDSPPEDPDTIRLLQRYLVKPALSVYATHRRASEDIKLQTFNAALKCLALIAVGHKDLAMNALGFCTRGAMGAVPPQHSNRALQCVIDIVMAHPSMGTLTFGELVKEAVITGAFIRLCLIFEELRLEASDVQSLPQLDRVMSILLEYSDPTNLVIDTKQDQEVEADTHLILASKFLQKVIILITDGNGRDDPAVCCVAPFCRALNQMRFLANADHEALRQLLAAVSGILADTNHVSKVTSQHLSMFQRRLQTLLDNGRLNSENEAISLEQNGTQQADGKRKRRSTSSDEEKIDIRKPKRRSRREINVAMLGPKGDQSPDIRPGKSVEIPSQQTVVSRPVNTLGKSRAR
ncbi:hypothetical protein FRC17_003118 [Serendipita sp. 399]|nr:hypothetical protein FRC17_003118 [Serendipita sp. 399]